MKKSLLLIFISILVSGCYQSSLTMMGPAAGASQGKMLQSSITSVANYAIKQKTGKSTFEHVFQREKSKIVTKVAHVEKKVLEKTKKLIINNKSKKIHKKVAKNSTPKVKWVLGLHEIKKVSQEEAFKANKPTYSYLSKEK